MLDIAYFDNAATTFPKPECVYQAMDDFARNCGVSLGRGQHKLSSKASFIADETRELILKLFHCNNKKVIYTNTATEALNIILFGLPMNQKNIYISPFEHNAVTRTLHQIAKKNNIKVEQLSVNKDDFSFNLDEIQSQFKNLCPDYVIVSHASNVIGSIAPIKEIFTMAKNYNAINIVDMSQTAGLIDTDLSSQIYDYAVFAGHKTLYAPIGISGFICQNPNLLPPIIYGGTGIESANQEMPSAPSRFEAGSHNSTAIAGLNSSIKWITEIGVENIYLKELTNYKKLTDILNQYNNITYYKPKEHIGVISCLFDNYSSDEIGQVLSENNIACRSGLHCSPLSHKFLGTFPSGTVRLSLGFFNNDSDLNKLNDVLKYIYDNS